MKLANAARLAAGTALATLTLSGCTTKVAAPASVSAATAQAALAQGHGEVAVKAAEAAVLATPRDAMLRGLLGAAYLKAGRFVSAATAYADAVALGDTSPRTALNHALALAATGKFAQAQTLLVDHRAELDPADYGLALALAGSPAQAVEALGETLRNGGESARLRQNIAYAFALGGDWRSARLIASRDLPADKLEPRLAQWAKLAMPQQEAARVAMLLGVTPNADAGQPAQLALSNFPTNEQLAASAVAADTPVPTPAPTELAAADAAPAPTPTPVADAEAAAVPAVTAMAAMQAAPYLAQPKPAAKTVQSPKLAVARAEPRRAPAKASTAAFDADFAGKQGGGYSVQLGSFASASSASQAWTRFLARHPQLRGAQRVVTKANVGGKVFYRVAAAGFERNGAASFCDSVKRSGGGCLTYASTRGLPGHGAQPTRVASR